MTVEPLLQVQGLRKLFPIRQGLFQRVAGHVRAVDGVDFEIGRGEVFGLAGESGSGKSTVARILVGLFDPSEGRVRYRGEDVVGRQGTRAFKKRVQMVFQHPGSSLNPRRSIEQSLMVPLMFHRYPRERRGRRIAELLEMVELPVAVRHKHPHELSGGQKQRVAIARALAVEPELIVLDEPTSSLDVSVQAKVLELLLHIQRELGLSYLFISHDLSLMSTFTDRVGVMYLGKLAEVGPTREVFRWPRHPYTRGLIASVPVVSDEEEALKPDAERIRGEIPSPAAVPSGCSFHPRCPRAFEPCAVEDPEVRRQGAGHGVRCHLYGDGPAEPPGG